MEIIKGSVTTPKGFSACGVQAKLKHQKKDMAMLVSSTGCVLAGAFTTNKVKAAPVLWDKAVLESGKPVYALVVNSGNANACTGKQGFEDTVQTAEMTASVLDKGFGKENVLVASTGVIGVPLPMDKIKNGVELCAKSLSADGGHDAAEAICTTDTCTKEICVKVSIGDKDVILAGMAKGSGMIHPNMATMLSFITTDASVKKESLQKLLGTTISDSYHMVSVDGDTSTNDTVLVLANGQSGCDELDEKSPYWQAFSEAFLFVHTYIAKEIVRDGEGASKFIEVHVAGAPTKNDAKVLAKSVISSSLVKAAFFGSDANWGRILCAMGYSGADFNPMKVTLSFSSAKGGIEVVNAGTPIAFDEAKAKEILMEKEIHVEASVGDDVGEATAWGCDLTYDYVRINGDYRS